MSQKANYWNSVYQSKQTDEVSWFQAEPNASLEAIALCGGRNMSVIDIGGGASRLVGALLDQRRRDVTVLDISAKALTLSRARLGAEGDHVAWIATDITTWRPQRQWDIWHDRAVFHFLTEAADRTAYLRALKQAVRSGGFAILASFAPEGPDSCSGLPVQKYSPESLAAELGAEFELQRSWEETHETPNGGAQAFTWCLFKKI